MKDRVLIIGGSHGIGAATAKLFLAHGAHVAVADKNPGKGDLHVDVADVRLMAELARALADDPPNIVIVTAGLQIAKPHDRITERELKSLFLVNGFGPVLASQMFGPGLRKLGRSRGRNAALTIVASVAGLTNGGPGLEGYGMSKAAAINWTRSMARELAPEVRVNCVCPGWTDTPFNDPTIALSGGREAHDLNVRMTVPLQREARPREIAETIMWISSKRASYVTGHVLVADGGLTL